MTPRLAALGLALLGHSWGMKCPGSSSYVHASAQVEGIASASCKEVMEEIKARVTGDWHDPRNSGHYSLLNESVLELALERVTSKAVDKMTFTFSDFQGSRRECGIHACSESQIFSITDSSANYCNLRNLYCGLKDGCEPVKHDFKTTEIEVTASTLAGTDKTACLTGAEATPMLRQSPLLGDTVDDTLACINDNCPLDESTLSPRPSCVLANCTSRLAKCLFSSTCLDGVMCELKCTKPLAKTEDAVHFASLMECMRVHCPGFPPKKSCAALHCGVEAAECAVHSKCRETLECADKCVPGKYTAAVAAMPLETTI